IVKPATNRGPAVPGSLAILFPLSVISVLVHIWGRFGPEPASRPTCFQFSPSLPTFIDHRFTLSAGPHCDYRIRNITKITSSTISSSQNEGCFPCYRGRRPRRYGSG
ncbi:hypothetical protein ASPACDRAFT_1871745, partial [Aspergillus aculeatus ATCC 16872]